MRIIDRSSANRPRVMLAAAAVALVAATVPAVAQADLVVPTPAATHAVTTHVATAPASSPAAAPQGGGPVSSPAPAPSSGGAPATSGSAPNANGSARPTRTPPTDSQYGFLDSKCDAGCHRDWKAHYDGLYQDLQDLTIQWVATGVGAMPPFDDVNPVRVALINLTNLIDNDKASLGSLYENLTNPVWSPGYTQGSDIWADCSMVMQPLTMANWIAEDGGGASGAC